MEINDKGYIYIYFNGSSMFNRCVYFCDFFYDCFDTRIESLLDTP